MNEHARAANSFRLNAHRRLALGLAVFAVLALLLPASMALTLRLAMSWDFGVGTFLALTWWVVEQCPAQEMRRTVLANDQGKVGVLAVVLVAVAASIAAIFFVLEKPKTGTGGPPAVQVAFAVATIACSWLMAHVMFALHYAHRFYRDDPATPEKDATGGLNFPGTESPNYWDFLYFSFVIGMTSQVSDVQVTSSAMRELVFWHGLLSFAFYTIVLALSINIVAGLI
ncbi:MAG: DUF1345 domain-containing protein [Betaproteobacteria bacterium]|nr:DUF1345 domain-containing protein [Betaproteobacteria bacterium]